MHATKYEAISLFSLLLNMIEKFDYSVSRMKINLIFMVAKMNYYLVSLNGIQGTEMQLSKCRALFKIFRRKIK